MRDELTDPWGLLLAAVAAVAAWAIDIPWLAAAGVGVATWLVRAAFAAAQTRRVAVPAAPRARRKGSAIRAGSEEARWVDRAERAVGGFADLAAQMPAGSLADEVTQMRARMTDALDYLRRLAGQATLSANTLARVDDASLAGELRRLEQARRVATPDIAREHDRAIAAVQAQQQVRSRLGAARETALARLASDTLELEALAARVAELAAMGGPETYESTEDLDDLADDLDGIRAGLAEAEEVTRRILSAGDGIPG